MAKANNKAVNLNCRNIARLENHVAELAAYTNLLHISINTVLKKLDSLYEFSVMGQTLPILENVVTYLLHTNRRMIKYRGCRHG